jgi:hypothetical protein
VVAGGEVVTFAASVSACAKSHGRLAEGKEISEMIGMDVFERSIAEQAAIESAWRWFRRGKKPKIAPSEIVERVDARCPGVSHARIKSEIESRMSR